MRLLAFSNRSLLGVGVVAIVRSVFRMLGSSRSALAVERPERTRTSLAFKPKL